MVDTAPGAVFTRMSFGESGSGSGSEEVNGADPDPQQIWW